MAKENLKNKAFSGFLWMFMERIGAQMVTFIVSLILARILLPDDYGVVALAQIFIGLANVFVMQGLNASLIQRDDAGDLEFSTAFYANISLSILLYTLLFFVSPLVSAYYGKTELTLLFRILALRLPLGALNSIQRAYVSRRLQFKRFFFATLGGTIISALVGIVMAMKGCGYWAIVGQYLTNSVVDTIVLWFTVKWRPKKLFSFAVLKELVSFGWKVLAAAFFNEVYLELRSLIIGKKYSSEDLAFYNRGKQFPQLFYTNIASAITSVMFPVMSIKKSDNEGLKRNLSSAIQLYSYILFPILFGMATIAAPLVKLLLTDKWLPCVPFVQAYCISYAILPIQSIQEQLYKAKGKSGLVLGLFFLEKSVGIITIIITMRISVLAIAIGMLITAFFSTITHSIPMKRLLGFSLLDLLKDLLPALLSSASMATIVFLVGKLPLHLVLIIILQVLTGILFYFLVSVVTKSKPLKVLLELVENKTKFIFVSKIKKAIYK